MSTMRQEGDAGPIRVSVNGRYFVDRSGEPFFWLGDTLWDLFRDFSAPDADVVLKARKRQGFSAVQIMITGVGDGAKPNLSGQTPWIKDDPAAPNEAYFKNVDGVMEAGRLNGLVLVLGVFHQRQVARITPANARGYARWIARRYRDAPNVIWSMYPKAEQDYIPVLRELATGLREGDGGAHLITVHPDPSPASSSFIHDEPWLDFNSSQPWNRYEMVYGMVTADCARTPEKPAVMAEAGYEGVRTLTPLIIRKQAYWSHLAGGHHSYGHDDNWRSPSSWRSWVDSPGAGHMGVYRKIVTSCREWWNWVPDQSIFAGGASDGPTLNAAARSTAGDWILAYLSSNTTVSIQMDKITAGDAVEASWFDPTTGTRTRIGGFTNRGVQSFSTPSGWEDAVLLLEARK